jgi:hypothetical protein
MSSDDEHVVDESVKQEDDGVSDDDVPSSVKQQQMKNESNGEGVKGEGEATEAFDKGGHLSEETTGYFRTVLDLLEANEFESPEGIHSIMPLSLTHLS